MVGGTPRAPADLSRDEWDEYQGNFRGVEAAVKRLVQELDNRIKRDRAR